MTPDAGTRPPAAGIERPRTHRGAEPPRPWPGTTPTGDASLAAARAAEGVSVLYVSYDGLLDPLGQSQIVPYVTGLRACGFELHLLTFEKSARGAAHGLARELGERLRQMGIRWRALRYHKRPAVPATLWDVVRGLLVGAAIVRRHGIRIVHARSYLAALIALALKDGLGVRFLFDMRGFWADERVDARILKPGGALYRAAKLLERVCLGKADAVITLTEAARREVEAFDYLSSRCPAVTVIPTCVDLSHFQLAAGRARRATADAGLTLVYAGSLGTWYPIEAMLAFFDVMRREVPGSRFLILTPDASPEVIEATARRRGITAEALEVRHVPYREMPGWVGVADVGVILSAASWANKGRCPTKLGELLACGVPVVVSRGLGDTETIVRNARVGVVVEELTEREYRWAMLSLLALMREPDLRRRCREAAERYFALGTGVLRYRQVYEALAGVRATGEREVAS